MHEGFDWPGKARVELRTLCVACLKGTGLVLELPRTLVSYVVSGVSGSVGQWSHRQTDI